MKNLGIKSRVIFLATVPALLFALILVGYAITNIFGFLNKSLHDRGQIIASQLAPAAEYGVIAGNRQILQQLTEQALAREPDLKSVLIVDNEGELLASSGVELDKEFIPNILSEDIHTLKQKKEVVFTSPIYRNVVEVDDFSQPNIPDALKQKKQDLEKIGFIYVELSYQTLKSIKYDFVGKVFAIGLLGLLLSMLLALRIGRNITHPIQEIARAVNKVREGELAQVISEDSSGELRTLQKGFNSMSTSLQHAHDLMQDRINDATALLRYQAQHDDLTGLINRREFEIRLERCLKNAHEQKTQHVFCYMDLDQFKLVNDTCGHVAGDGLLKQVSTLLAIRMREKDTLARLGGDEFGLLLENCTLTEANHICNIILRIVRDFRFIHDEKIFNVGVSIGLVVINDQFANVSEVIHAADSACFNAKKSGKNQSVLYSDGDIEVAQHRTAVEAISDITDEIDDEQFALYCQPIVALLPNLPVLPHMPPVPKFYHYEILLRKIDLDGKMILPTAFIASAERYHLMPNIDRWVIKNAFIAYRKLLDINREHCQFIFSVNLSGTSLSDITLLGYIQEQFVKYSVPPSAVCFEITETAAIVNLKNTILLFSALQKMGCTFALDDFGSGMSSFMYLKNFDVNYLKIDGSFVKEMHINRTDHAMVRSIHNVAESMNIKTVAEFVENEAILKQLEIIGVHYGQGLHLGAPMKVKDLIEEYAKLHA
ncbi:MAG TPA: EAL domain-containing protein [Methylotenera sp.]|nr:EAL domain-containing protein [Methylotenera sp.]HPH05407.1 EAL domain-containing protein [Methylotenera sp.]HPN01526.1 EAL domain-containing protein [Methylotenera sp.]